jgi:cytoskeletal protein RodZ
MYGDDNNVDNFEDDDGNPPEESNNRTFLFIAGGLGILVLIGLCAVVAYFFLNNRGGANAEATAQSQLTAQAATVQVGLTQTAVARASTQGAAATATLPPTSTPVISVASATASPTSNPATATVGAAFTQIAAQAAAVTTGTVIATSTALPNTGFADDVGLPGMFALALALVIVIFLVRRLRAVPAR